MAAEVFCAGPISQIIRGGFWERLSYHQQRNHDVFVVTATPRFILEPWCVRNGIRIIGSELRYTKEGLVTGTLDGRNCMGQEKVDRVRNKVDLSKYETVYAYGDTSGDLPMLNLAPPENRYYKPFRS